MESEDAFLPLHSAFSHVFTYSNSFDYFLKYFFSTALFLYLLSFSEMNVQSLLLFHGCLRLFSIFMFLWSILFITQSGYGLSIFNLKGLGLEAFSRFYFFLSNFGAFLVLHFQICNAQPIIRNYPSFSFLTLFNVPSILLWSSSTELFVYIIVLFNSKISSWFPFMSSISLLRFFILSFLSSMFISAWEMLSCLL